MADTITRHKYRLNLKSGSYIPQDGFDSRPVPRTDFDENEFIQFLQNHNPPLTDIKVGEHYRIWNYSEDGNNIVLIALKYGDGFKHWIPLMGTTSKINSGIISSVDIKVESDGVFLCYVYDTSTAKEFFKNIREGKQTVQNDIQTHNISNTVKQSPEDKLANIEALEARVSNLEIMINQLQTAPKNKQLELNLGDNR